MPLVMSFTSYTLSTLIVSTDKINDEYLSFYNFGKIMLILSFIIGFSSVMHAFTSLVHPFEIS